MKGERPAPCRGGSSAFELFRSIYGSCEVHAMHEDSAGICKSL